MKVSPANIFQKTGELRAWCRLLIFVVVWSYCLAGLFTLARPLFTLTRGGFPQHSLLIWLLSFLAVLIPTALMALIEHRPLGTYGLPARGAFGILFWKGAFWGLATVSGLLLALRLAGVFYFGQIVLHGRELLWYAGSWALVWLLLGLFEQYTFLGYPQFTLTSGIGFWPAAVLLSVTNGAMHLSFRGDNWAAALPAGLLALFAALTLRRTGTLWFAVGMQTSYNWCATFLYSVPDAGKWPPGHLISSHLQGPAWLTGGSVGPEGGVCGYLMLAVLFLVFHLRFAEVKYPHDFPPPSLASFPSTGGASESSAEHSR